MFINATELFWIATTYRAINITGRYGSGKTLLSVAMAYELWRKDYVKKIYANFPMAGRELDYPDGDKDFVMILDEAHIVLDARAFSKKASQSWLKDLRKRNSVIILPAVIGVDIRFRAVMVQRMMMIGNLFWVYRWQIDDGMGVHGSWFVLVNPSKYFGAYETRYSPRDEDFDLLQRVMTGKVEIANDPTIEGKYLPVMEISHPIDEPAFEFQVREPTLKRLFGSDD